MEMQVSRVFKFDGEGPLKAMCDVTLGGQIVIKGFRIVNGRNGLFVGLPQELGKNGKWYDRVQPLTDQTKQELTDTVLKAYEKDEA